ncbi:uncharacterized protein [Drosophila pseudoobscura]|uniref:Uncharacterized protein isoform X3 n=1 Tax=Drosophila pseudoobscura pseudoobscura TaxID=46245 RepID=A0A6I8VTN5_DROPS|nr:uncharacterized protein LOC4804367 isoform X3 [Drosophila pseudoobscura]
MVIFWYISDGLSSVAGVLLIMLNKNFSTISNCFPLVCKTIETQCGITQQGPVARYELDQLLRQLNAKERLPANVGSFRVLLQLQQLRILTATEYILSKEHSEQLQVNLIIFLETEYELLANLFVSAAYDAESGMKLSAILADALGNLFTGLVADPKISNLSYVDPLCSALPAADAMGVCMNMHLSTLLELHKAKDINEAFASFSAWINEGVDELTFVKLLCEKLFACHHQEALQVLFKQSNSENFTNWKFYLILVQSIASTCNSETTAFMKKYLKSRVLHMATTGCLTSLLHLLLTARATSACTMDIHSNLDNYAKWYKQNIGEMSYLLRPEHFQMALGLLEESLHYESELQYLEIHAAIALSPGGRIVQAYKTKCRAYLSQLKKGEKA